jgi:chromosome segregation ATPase
MSSSESTNAGVPQPEVARPPSPPTKAEPPVPVEEQPTSSSTKDTLPQDGINPTINKSASPSSTEIKGPCKRGQTKKNRAGKKPVAGNAATAENAAAPKKPATPGNAASEDAEKPATEKPATPGNAATAEKPVSEDAEQSTIDVGEKVAIQQEGDPSKPHLLRIGEKGFAEYIELKPGGILSRGNFNALGSGYAQSELPKLYNVRTPEQYKAMQTAFAIKSRQTKLLPVYEFIQRKCKFPGYDLVVEALNIRQKTLQTSIDILQSSDPSKALVNKQRLKWITQLLKDLEPLASAEICPVVEKKQEEKPLPATGSCIQDLNLLRDLIYLLVLLHGSADPAVKKQLDSIPLEKLLNSAKKNNAKQSKELILVAIDALYKALKTAKENKATEIPSDALKIIFKALAPEEPIPADLTTEVLISKIQTIKQSMESGIQSAQELDSTKLKILETEKELLEAHATLEELNKQVETTLSLMDNDIKEYLKQIEVLKAQIAELEASLNKEKSDLAAAKANLAEKEQTIATKDGLLDTINKQLGETSTQQKAAQEALQAQLDAKTAELDALRTELQGKLDTLTKEKTELQNRSETQGQTIEQLEKRIAELETTIQQKENLLSSTRQEFSDEKGVSEKAKETIQKQEEELKQCRDELAETTTHLTDANTLVREFQLEIKNLEDSINAYKILVDGKDAEIAKLKESLEEKSKEVGYLEKRITNTTEEFEQAKAEVDALEGILEALRQTYNDQLTKSQTAILELTRQLGQSEEQVAKLTGQLESLQTNLGETLLKASQVTSLTEELNRKNEELATERANLTSLKATCEKESELATAEIDRLKNDLQLAKTAAETLQRQLEEAKEASSANVGRLQTELDSAKLNIETLSRELQAKGSAQTQAGKLYDENKQKLESRITELETQLEEFRESSAKEKEEAVTQAVESEKQICKSETDKRDETIADLEEKLKQAKQDLDTLRNDTSVKITRIQADANASVESAKANLEAAQSQLSEVAAELATTGAERDGIFNEFETYKVTSQKPIAIMEEQISTLTSQKEAEKSRANSLQEELDSRPSTDVLASKDERIKALENTIKSLQLQISSLQSASKESDETHVKLLEDLRSELEKNYESGSKENKLTIHEQIKMIEKLGADMEELERKYSILRYKDSQSKERLQNLLGMVLIDDELLQTAMDFMDGKDVDSNSLKEPLCEFFLYLSGLVNLQHQKIERSGLPTEAKTDIFNIFEKIPSSYDKHKLLKELSSLFQEIFVNVGKTNTIPSELTFKNSYSEINKVFGTNGYKSINGKPLKTSINLIKITIELGTFGYMSDIGITPEAPPAEPGMFKLRKGSLKEFSEENKSYYTPLVILGIKLIQLLEGVLEEKYKTLITKCGLKSPTQERPMTADITAKAQAAIEKLELTKGTILGNISNILKAIDNLGRFDEDKRKYYIEYLKQLVQWAKSESIPFNPDTDITKKLKKLKLL